MSLIRTLRDRYSHLLLVQIKSTDLETAFIKLFLKEEDFGFQRTKASVASVINVGVALNTVIDTD